MARINIETSVYQDFRFQNLLIKIGCRKKAKGELQELWELAQQYWCPNKQLIPLEVFKKSDLSDALIETGWAEIRGNGVYAKGSEDQFAWLIARSHAGRIGGKKSADNRAQAKASKSKQKQPSLLFTPYSLLSSLSSDSLLSPQVAKRKRSPTPTKALLDARREMHLQVHGVEPIGGPQVNGILANLVREVGQDDAIAIMRYFYRVPNSFYKTKGHDVKLLTHDKAKLLTEVRRQAPIIPDGREDSFKAALKSQSRQDEIERHFSEVEEV